MHEMIISELENPQLSHIHSSSLTSLHSWLLSVGITAGLPSEIPQKFTDGTLLCSLIRRLEGRSCTLNFNSHPKTTSACRVNVKKALEYLKAYPKFHSRYLWSHEEILAGHSDTVTGILKDLMQFYPKCQRVCKSSENPSRAIRQSSELEVLQEEMKNKAIQEVKGWLKELGLLYLLEVNQRNYLKDPLRNGVLLCKVVKKVKAQFEFYSHPKSVDDVWENINTALWMVKKEIPVERVNSLTEKDAVWEMLNRIMLIFRDKESPPFEEQADLQPSAFKWVYSLRVFDQGCPENIHSLVRSMRTGVLLARIVEKLTNTHIGYYKYPQTKAECLKNINESLFRLQSLERMSKELIWDSDAIYSSNEPYVIGLLQDLQRYFLQMPPRKPSETLTKHAASPSPKSVKPSTPHTLGRSLLSSAAFNSGRNSLHSTRGASPISYQALQSLSHSTSDFFKFQPKPLLNLKGFDWLNKLLPTLPKIIDLTADKIKGLKNGEVLCELLEVLEAKTLPKFKDAKNHSAAAAKNIRIVLEILKKKPSFSSQLMLAEDKIMNGDGPCTRRLLKEIYRLYENTIITLIKFKSKPKD